MSFKTVTVVTKYDTKQAIDLGNEDGLVKVGALTVSQAKALMIPDTGLLRNSVMYKTKRKKGGFNDSGGSPANKELQGTAEKDTLYVGSNTNYAIYEEFGTRNRGAKPYLRPAVDIVVRGRNGQKAMADALNKSINKAKIKSRVRR